MLGLQERYYTVTFGKSMKGIAIHQVKFSLVYTLFGELRTSCEKNVNVYIH